MSNTIADACESLSAEGYSISAVTISRAGRGRLMVAISRNNYFPLGEGDSGESGVHVDTRDMPDGVTVRGYERCEDYQLHLDGAEEQAEALIGDVATVGQAQDWKRFDGDTPDYPHWLTKPNKWHRLTRGPT